MSIVKKVLMLGESLNLPRTQWQLDTMLQRAGISRGEFYLAEVGESLEGQEFGCALALGKGAMGAILPEPFDKAGLDSRRGYVEWSSLLNCWVIPTYDPSFIMRGNQKLTGVWINDIQHALAIAGNGHQPHKCSVLEDPTPMEFFEQVLVYEDWLRKDPGYLLAYDIETLGKQSTKEDELDLGDQSYTITRIGFCHTPGEAVSVPWSAEYMPHIARLMASDGTKVAHNCPTPDQRVLCADLVWRAAGDLKLGEKLVGFDEELAADRRLRRYGMSTVVGIDRGYEEVIQVTLSDGSCIKTTANHPWLLGKRTHGRNTSTSYGWIETNRLRIGRTVQRLFDPWEVDQERSAGYLAGFFDGEGHLRKQKGCSMLCMGAQNSGPTLDRVLGMLKDRNYAVDGSEGKLKCKRFRIHGGTRENARFLGSVRPLRLLDKFQVEMLGAAWAYMAPILQITRIESLGVQEVIRLGTDNHTYILEGFGAHNSNYDRPRVTTNGIAIKGRQMDTMWAWHVANSDLEKGLGFVATFCCPDQPRWKHLGHVNQAFYNATDAEVTLRIMHTMEQDLKQMGLWDVYVRHICELDQNLLWPMTKAGVLLDDKKRREASIRLSAQLVDITREMAAVVPIAAQRLKVYKSRPPKGVELEELQGEKKAKRCSRCGLVGVTKPHTTRKMVEAHTQNLLEGVQGPSEGIRVPNPCLGATIETVMVPAPFWGLREPFVPSNAQMQTYQKVVGHRPQLSKEKRPTFDDEAIQKLCKRYPKDRLYPLVSAYSNVSKILGTYIGVYNE